MKPWNEVKKQVHDASGITAPASWLWEKKDGVFYPVKKSGKEPVLLVNSACGIYAAQMLVKNFKVRLAIADKLILAKGPDHDDYVQTWADVVEGADIDMQNGEVWEISENEGDIWAVPPGTCFDDFVE